MAAAKKCDRCGRLFEKEEVANFQLSVVNVQQYWAAFSGTNGIMDLCPRCAQVLEDWFTQDSESIQNTCCPHDCPGTKKRWWEK